MFYLSKFLNFVGFLGMIQRNSYLTVIFLSLEDTRTVTTMLDLIMTHPDVPEGDLFQQRLVIYDYKQQLLAIDIFLKNLSHCLSNFD